MSPYSLPKYPPMIALIKIKGYLVYFLYTKSIHYLYHTAVVYIFSIHQIYTQENYFWPLDVKVYILYTTLMHQGYAVYILYTTLMYQGYAVYFLYAS